MPSKTFKFKSPGLILGCGNCDCAACRSRANLLVLPAGLGFLAAVTQAASDSEAAHRH